MALAIFKVFFSAAVIGFCSWLAGRRPDLAGFIIAMPLLTLLALPFAQVQYHDPEASIRFARSILAGVPVSLLFFVPFLLAGKLQWNFWALYGGGVALLVAGYFLHRWIMSLI